MLCPEFVFPLPSSGPIMSNTHAQLLKANITYIVRTNIPIDWFFKQTFIQEYLGGGLQVHPTPSSDDETGNFLGSCFPTNPGCLTS